ncbi:VanZ family protein [Cellulophaga sp. F20128]|uniref:VanZ family protein n=1 Tax=Cellulophaga sp. F20128 TaxID=2926413 RepID=UPI001FF5C0E8|nr:VanZ family protein [Cellulophaga sp. F20128]
MYTILFISWVVFVAFLSLFSFSGTDLPTVQIPHLDKLVHFTFYFVASVLGTLAIKECSGSPKIGKRVVWYLVGSLIAYGIIIEVLQSKFTATRSGEILDFVANTIGVFAGIIVARFLFLRKEY